MEEQALGMIETFGLVGLIEAADAVAKAAKVIIVDYEQAEGGLVIIKFRGSVGAVKAALEAGAAAAQRIGKLWATHIIPRPDPQIEFMIERKKGTPPATPVAEPPEKPTPPPVAPERKEESGEVKARPFKLEQSEQLEPLIEKIRRGGLEFLNTAELRVLARSLPDFPFPPAVSGKMRREEILKQFMDRGVILPGLERVIFPTGEAKERKMKIDEEPEETEATPFVLVPEPGEEKIVETLSQRGIEGLHIKQLRHLAHKFKNFPVVRIDQASRDTLIEGFRRGIIIEGIEGVIKPKT